MNFKQIFCSHRVKSGSPLTDAKYIVNDGTVVVAQLVCQRCEKVTHEAKSPFYGRYDENRPRKEVEGE